MCIMKEEILEQYRQILWDRFQYFYIRNLSRSISLCKIFQLIFLPFNQMCYKPKLDRETNHQKSTLFQSTILSKRRNYIKLASIQKAGEGKLQYKQLDQRKDIQMTSKGQNCTD